MYEKKQGVYIPGGKHRSICAGCGAEIEDQYVLRVSSGLEWHPSCLRCIHCRRILDENDTCFVRNQNIFCKPDYIRLFGSKCDKCELPFSSESEYVMKLQNAGKIFHLDCFACLTCGRRLVPGDKFALRVNEDLGTALLCREHFELLDKGHLEPQAFTLRCDNVFEENGLSGPPRHPSFHEEVIKREENEGLLDLDEFGEEDESSGSFEGYLRGERGGGGGQVFFEDPSSCSSSSSSYKSSKSSSSANRRIGRVRTVLSEKQLSVLQQYYSANPRPDANLKEQLVEMTGLSSRVIRVWFQNKRCKDKKTMNKRVEREGLARSYGAMPPGIPLVASPPLLAEADCSSLYGAQIHSYPTAWPNQPPPPPPQNIEEEDNNNSKMYNNNSSLMGDSRGGDYSLTCLDGSGSSTGSSLIIGSEA
eukprot:TRINITY_DN6429_c0_g1_i1.p1 TRINITY_DN6429_c0_g1~~TRINITY_DN6429_c0_g1_i1.p1  ORF type:complete len:419 (-),score=151.60 TRINITY_DN6429_c0_g1_i1:192-1448(-)